VIAIVTGTRHDADISQRELARRLHVTRNTIANIESGRRKVQAAELPTIVKALGVSMDTFLRRLTMWYATIDPPLPAATAQR
jgi:transcriptional regulator with XRE-family HTH domain